MRDNDPGCAPWSAQAAFEQALQLHRQGQLEAARAGDEAIRARDPGHADTAHLLAGLLGGLGEASDCFHSALACDPDLPEAHINLGVLQRQAGQYEASIASYDRALARRPHDSTALGNRANALRESGQFDAALAGYKQALALAPDDAQLRTNLGIHYLQQGQFERSWEGYAYRTQAATPPGVGHTPRWNGRDDLRGKTIALHGEQGLGDTIQFCRYARMVAQRGRRSPSPCRHRCARRWPAWPVCTRCAARRRHCPRTISASLLSLPLAFQTMADSIPAPVPYLFAQPDRLAQWQARLGPRSLHQRRQCRLCGEL